MPSILAVVFVIGLVPALAAAQERPARELFAGYQQLAGGEGGALHGAALGLVFRGKARTSGVLTLAGFYDPRNFSVWQGDSRIHSKGGETSVLVGGGGRWHKPDGRVLFFAQAQVMFAFSRSAIIITTDSPVGVSVRRYRRTSFDPLLQAGFGLTIRATRRVGLTGSFEVHHPIFSRTAEGIGFRSSLGATIALSEK